MVDPARAELAFGCRRSPVSATGRGSAGVAARDGGAEERCVEGVFVKPEPATQRRAGAAAPGSAFGSFHDSWRLAEEVCALACGRLDHRPRLEWKARVDAQPAAGEVALERGERAVRRHAASGERAATNHRPEWIVSPPPTSDSSVDEEK